MIRFCTKIMYSVSHCCAEFGVVLITVLVLTCAKFGFAQAILNEGTTMSIASTEGTWSPLTIPAAFQEGHTHHKLRGNVFRLKTRAARKRQLPATTAAPPGACACMDYWECAANNGQVYTYCGISDSEVCCFFHEHKLEENVHKRKYSNQSPSAIKTTSELGTIPTKLPTTPQVSFAETFATGNDERSFTTATTTNVEFATATSLPFVDYYYSLEDDIGELKQITAKTEKYDDKVIGKANVGRNYDGSSCGTQSVEWKLNSKAEFKEWPWHVAVLENHQDLYICGGEIIGNDMIVTAAHCVNSYAKINASKLKIRAGEYDVSTNDEVDPHVEVAVKEIFVHPSFNNVTLANDIALVKLRQPLNYTDNIKPICLPQSLRLHAPKKCVVTGWGRDSESSPFSIVLKEIVVPLWTHQDCEEKLRENFGNSYELAETAICAGERGHDACDGDGGGGMYCEVSGRFYLAGITSYGIGCGRSDSPGVYTSVASHLNWIEASHYFENQ